METFKIQNGCNQLDLFFLQNTIAQLRKHKGRYISITFLKDLEDVCKDLLSAIQNTTQGFSKTPHLKPKKISDSDIDGRLQYMEERLQELAAEPRPQKNSMSCCMLTELYTVLCTMALQIRYSFILSAFEDNGDESCITGCVTKHAITAHGFNHREFN